MGTMPFASAPFAGQRVAIEYGAALTPRSRSAYAITELRSSKIEFESNEHKAVAELRLFHNKVENRILEVSLQNRALGVEQDCNEFSVELEPRGLNARAEARLFENAEFRTSFFAKKDSEKTKPRPSNREVNANDIQDAKRP